MHAKLTDLTDDILGINGQPKSGSKIGSKHQADIPPLVLKPQVRSDDKGKQPEVLSTLTGSENADPKVEPKRKVDESKDRVFEKVIWDCSAGSVDKPEDFENSGNNFILFFFLPFLQLRNICLKP